MPNILKRHRLAAGLSQQQLADSVGVSKGFISALEGGRSVPNLYMLVQLADALNVRPGTLVEEMVTDAETAIRSSREHVSSETKRIPMKSVFTKEHGIFLEVLVAARTSQGLTQAVVAERLKKPQSFVSKYESGERRLDVVEFFSVARALHKEPHLPVQGNGVHCVTPRAAASSFNLGNIKVEGMIACAIMPSARSVFSRTTSRTGRLP